jgi:outer membrane protein TolC
VLLWLAVLSGCQPRHPWYLTRNDDLATYIDAATELAYPDVDRPMLAEVTNAGPPMTLNHSEFREFWDLSLQEALNIALHNSKVIRTVGGVRVQGQPDALIARPETVGTVYDPALIESDPNFGVEAALSEFDAQFTSGLFWNTTDRPQNRLGTIMGPAGDVILFPTVLSRNAATFNAEVSKRSATGTQFFFRNITEYDRSNAGGGFQALNSFYTTQFEAEARHPLLRGNGARINRVPLLIARIRTDISLAEFEANVRNLVQDVENAYWDLHCAYHNLQTTKVARDSALVSWRIAYNKFQAGTEPRQVEAQARQQYFTFRFQAEAALNDLYNSETNLRWLMGLTATDGRLIRPTDDPTMAKVSFDWPTVNAEGLVRSPELRRIKWFVKQRELEQIAARNRLLPDLNMVALYRWVGLGDELISSDRNGQDFPQENSTAFEGLTQGNFEEARVGFDFAFPIGFRQEYAQVRNAQLNLAREHARLEDAELNVSNALAQAIRNLDAQYNFALSHFNARIAAAQEVESVTQLYEQGLATLDLVLQAQQRRANSEILFFRALCEYNKAIAFVHFRKGSLLEYNSVYLAEGPWPAKAYFDAEGHAKRRAASFYLDYGWTQPPPVSIGPAPRGVYGGGDPPGFEFAHPDAVPANAEPIPTPLPDSGAPPQPLPAPPAGASQLDLAPPSPPSLTGRFDGNPGVLRTMGRHPSRPTPASHAGVAALPTAYPTFQPGGAAAMSYRGLGSAPAVGAMRPQGAMPPPTQHAAPPPSSRRTVEPAAFYAPIEPPRQDPFHRLPPIGVTNGAP